MIMIDALGKDGASILPDLQTSSPTGGFVQSEYRDGARLEPGDIVRHAGTWGVVMRTGMATTYGADREVLDKSPLAEILTADGTLHLETFWSCSGTEARTDTRIDPDSLAAIEPHEYRAAPDGEFPHLVNAQCSCGWRASGNVRDWLARRFHAQHVTEVERAA
jgi:hypothetical protein